MRLSEPLTRGTYIGGHEAAAIVGVHPHLSRADVWMKLTGRKPATSTPSDAMVRGLIVEHGLLRYVDHRLAKLVDYAPLTPTPFASFWQDDDVAFFGGSPDGVCAFGDSLVEVTTATERTRYLWGAEGSDRIAAHKYIQALWYMGLTGRGAAHAWCFFVDSDELLHYVVPRREERITELRDAAEAFWFDHVLADRPPAVDDAADPELLQAIYPKAILESTPASPSLQRAAAEYEIARAAAKVCEIEKKKCGVRLRAIMGDAAMSEWDGGSVYWTSTKLPPAVDWNAVANEIASDARLPMATFTDVVNRNTGSFDGARQLRVFTKKKRGAR